MRRFLIFFLGTANLMTGSLASAADAPKDICEALMAQKVPFFNEAKADRTGKPPIAEDGKEASTPYSRVHYRPSSLDHEALRIAVINSRDASPALESELKSLGFIGVAIRNPDDATVVQHPDYILSPEWVRTVMPLPTSIAQWIEDQGGSARGRLRRRLKKSEGIRSEIADLNWADYELWRTQLFDKEVLSRPGGIPTWRPAAEMKDSLGAAPDPNLPFKDQLVPNAKRIFFYSSSGELIGGTFGQFSAGGFYRIRAAAFEAHARSQYELAIRGFAIAIEMALEAGGKEISYGDDLGLAGIDTTVGLVHFKAGLGMQLVPSSSFKSWQLLKIFPEAQRSLRVDSEPGTYAGVLIFGIAGDDPKRVQRYHQLLAAGDESMPYPERIQITAANLTGFQVDADPEANPLKIPSLLKLRQYRF